MSDGLGDIIIIIIITVDSQRRQKKRKVIWLLFTDEKRWKKFQKCFSLTESGNTSLYEILMEFLMAL